MHAHANIHAVADPKPFGGSIAAAIASKEFAGIRHLLSRTDIETKIAASGPIALAELDKALASAGVVTMTRIVVKSALDRLGLLKSA